MALMDIQRRPSGKELRWFGVVVLAFFGLIGALVLWRAGSTVAATIIWAAGATLMVIYYAVRPLRLPIYLGWMYAVYPIGWLISHLLMAAIYFLLVTPTGVVMRWLGFDPLKRRFDPDASTYWADMPKETDRSRYFSQF